MKTKPYTKAMFAYHHDLLREFANKAPSRRTPLMRYVRKWVVDLLRSSDSDLSDAERVVLRHLDDTYTKALKTLRAASPIAPLVWRIPEDATEDTAGLEAHTDYIVRFKRHAWGRYYRAGLAVYLESLATLMALSEAKRAARIFYGVSVGDELQSIISIAQSRTVRRLRPLAKWCEWSTLHLAALDTRGDVRSRHPMPYPLDIVSATHPSPEDVAPVSPLRRKIMSIEAGGVNRFEIQRCNKSGVFMEVDGPIRGARPHNDYLCRVMPLPFYNSDERQFVSSQFMNRTLYQLQDSKFYVYAHDERYAAIASSGGELITYLTTSALGHGRTETPTAVPQVRALNVIDQAPTTVVGVEDSQLSNMYVAIYARIEGMATPVCVITTIAALRHARDTVHEHPGLQSALDEARIYLSSENSQIMSVSAYVQAIFGDNASPSRSDPYSRPVQYDNGSSPIMAYHASKRVLKRIPSEYDRTPCQVRLGLELEVDMSRRVRTTREAAARRFADQMQNYHEVHNGQWVATHRYAAFEKDGSVSNGFEMVTGWTGLDVHKRQLAALSTVPSMTKGCISHNSSRCGLHVHVSKAGMTPLHALKLFYWVNAYDNRDFMERIARRRNNGFATYRGNPYETGVTQSEAFSYLKQFKSNNRHSFHDIKVSSDKATELKEQMIMLLHGTRYSALNFHNKNTVEFRLFQGTLRYESVMAALEFAYISWYFTRDTGAYKLTVDNFIDYICQPRWRNETQFLRPYIIYRGYDSDEIKATLAKPDGREEQRAALMATIAGVNDDVVGQLLETA